jgi:aryl-alcohol dehydrogenase-like predicted oxidoreductase
MSDSLLKCPLGQTGLEVSALGWGTVKLGRNTQVKYPEGFSLPDDRVAAQLLHLVRDLGINLLDTAPAYGISEERLGKLLKGQRQDWVLCTKAGEFFDGRESRFDFSPAAIKLSVEQSLRRLRSDYIDLLLIHSDGDDSRLINELEVFRPLEELKRAGWIRAYGMSTKTLEGGLLTARHADLVMLTYNPDQRDQKPVIDECLRLHKGVLVKKALASGHLALDTRHADPVSASLSLVLGHPGVTSAVIGSINPDHLRNNVSKAREILATQQK